MSDDNAWEATQAAIVALDEAFQMLEISVQQRDDRIAELEDALRRLPSRADYSEAKNLYTLTEDEWNDIQDIRAMVSKEEES